ncbi:hypothetical protein [Acinetobacter sp. A47]|uniref:hypothetical protein n=1 Tax=Acinetobacter sp. A47 TaxID=1561217 RepID=UPI00056E17CE|nr:hypothetical protein [Acinetobacter sp. A47]
MTYHMHSEELKKLKRGDSVCIEGTYYVVKSAGHKWIYLHGLERPISIETARMKPRKYGHPDAHYAYATATLYNLAKDRAKRASVTFNALRGMNVWNTPEALQEELYGVLVKHNVIKNRALPDQTV